MPSDDYQVIIKPDKMPAGEHEGRFNAPTINEVAIVMVGTEFESRDIIIQKRDASLKRVTETHRSYDALQYPILFPKGEDDFIYRLMIRENAENHLLKFQRLFQQYLVDMYAKIESERLLYIRLNQKKLRVDNYIHLRDAIAKDGKTANLGQMVILPSTFTGSPRHMHEYAQDGMTYIRKYGRPDLFITFTCNPNWTEITELLQPGQSSAHRPDIVARVFKQKLDILLKLITKYHIYGKTRCWMYTIEWQKRGLPHAHILIWFEDKLKPDQIDNIISAEIPDPSIDKVLHDIVCKHMIHGPCGSLNKSSPCMKDGFCTKRYPREMIQETQTGVDSYPLYRRRSPDDGGHETIIRKKNTAIEIDNGWVVPYSPFFQKLLEHTSTLSPDMAAFGFAKNDDSYDEIQEYQMGRYISSNEAVWKILGFYVHERYPSVVQLAVHLENGQRV
ncbi:uncharacterized protein LOC129572604, partial [Sitodiplosis mosellana]|uniref:uncharacterized protein LOC129572604 n=1 Tax=Sitodiplosis mosellana TaxID=263140 RepID=UPI002443E821